MQLRNHPVSWGGRIGLWSAVLSFGLVGCSSLKLDPGPMGTDPIGTLPPASNSSEARKDYPVDLAELISLAVHDNHEIKMAKTLPIQTLYCVNAQTQKRRLVSSHAECTAEEKAASLADPFQSLEAARKHFYDQCPSLGRCGDLRDRVQDRLIWASESACASYLTNVRKSFTKTNLNLGSATTLFGALGSIFTSADAARVFSGAAGLTSGIRAEYNDVYFSSQAFELVSKAVRAVRERQLKRIVEARKGADIRAYTLDGAIADVMRLHGSCNVMAGLEEAAEAVTRERDPGLKHLNELLQSVGSGATVQLGTFYLNTQDLPSATRSCGDLNALTGEAAGIKTKIDLLKDATKSTDAQTKVAALDKVVTSASDCTATKDKPSNAQKLEQAMYDTMREFVSTPAEARAQKKALFESQRAAVLSTRIGIDRTVSDGKGIVGQLKELLKPD